MTEGLKTEEAEIPTIHPEGLYEGRVKSIEAGTDSRKHTFIKVGLTTNYGKVILILHTFGRGDWEPILAKKLGKVWDWSETDVDVMVGKIFAIDTLVVYVNHQVDFSGGTRVAVYFKNPENLKGSDSVSWLKEKEKKTPSWWPNCPPGEYIMKEGDKLHEQSMFLGMDFGKAESQFLFYANNFNLNWKTDKKDTKMLPDTEKALRDSSDHWRKNAQGDFDGIGPSDCALCVRFVSGVCERSGIFNTGHELCPIYTKTGKIGCFGSPYAKAREARQYYGVNSPEFLGAAREMVEFLEDLLQKTETKLTLDLTKPVQTRDGRAVRIISTEGKKDFPVVGLRTEKNGVEILTSFDKDGHRMGMPNYTDIINVPEKKKEPETIITVSGEKSSNINIILSFLRSAYAVGIENGTIEVLDGGGKHHSEGKS